MPDEEDAVESPAEDQWGLGEMLDDDSVESWVDEPIEKEDEQASWMDDSEGNTPESEEPVQQNEPASEEDSLEEEPAKQNESESEEDSLEEEPAKQNEPEIEGMLLGTRRDDGSTVTIPPTVLARHAAMLGSTGSGKTVMAKTLIEEATLAGIPSLILDPQGDLARLAL